MVLYVDRVDDPPAGADWSYMIPGQYLEHITGLTATLTTGGVAAVAHDSSGNGRDGAYGYVGGYPVDVAGLVAGDTAKQFADPTVPNTTPGQLGVPDLGFDLAATWSHEWWMQAATVAWNGPVISWTSSAADNIRIGGDDTWTSFGVLRTAFPNSDGAAWNLAGIADDGLPHYFVLTFDGATFALWVDGVLIVPSVVLPLIALTAGQTWAAICCDDGINTGLNATLDEIAIYQPALAAGQVAAHLAAAAGGIGTYAPAVLADAPAAYYHLDETTGGGRTPGLFVTDGTDETLLIPDGFTAQTTPGPYGYSWLPTLAADTRDPTGTVTSVAIPRLILPAGYVLGTRTPDIQPGDQWSDIAVWWNSDVMDAGADMNPFVYPPGAYLTITPRGG